MAEHAHGAAHEAAHGDHGDPDPEIRPKILARLALILAVVAIGYALLMWPVMQTFLGMSTKREDARYEVDPSRPPGPLLQSHPTTDLEQLRQREQQLLHSYGWRDRAGGIARVPVAVARELVLSEGLGGGAPFGQPELARGELGSAAGPAPAAPSEAPVGEDAVGEDEAGEPEH